MEVLRQFKEYYWKHRWLLFVSIICLMCATALGLVYPNLLRYLIDEVIKKEKFEEIPKLALLVVGVITVKGTFQLISGLAGGRCGNWVAYHLREAAYKKLQEISAQYYDKARTGDLMTRLTADLDAIRQFIGFTFAQILNVILMFIFGTIMLFSINWKLALITLATMPFLGFAAMRFSSRIHPAFRSIRSSFSDLTTTVQENITGVRTVKSFAREPQQIEKFTQRNEEYQNSNVKASKISAAYFPLMELLANLSVVFLFGAGGYLVLQKQISVGELVACYSVLYYIIGPMWNLGFFINAYTQSKTSAERILQLLNQYIHVKDKPNAIELKSEDVKGHIQFDNVTFAYPDNKPAIREINLDAPAGSVIGILGGTGSGKTTIIQLLLRAYNLKEGRILLDGQDIADLTYESLRKQISLVFQETFLFSASILNNIAYSNRNISMDAIIHASKLAKAHDFIMELPEGYNTVVGERGLGLSGGQKQRIAIARAILKDPKILVLDDATSAVDMETEHEIQSGLREVMKGRTTFVIAHRISSLKDADEILVLDEGKIVQRGTHEQLLKVPGRYLETFKIQYADQMEQFGFSAPASTSSVIDLNSLRARSS